MKARTASGSHHPTEKYDVEIKMLNDLISKTESSRPEEGSSTYFTLQQMKKRREALSSAIESLNI